MNQTVTYLQELTAIPSPTGFTREDRRLFGQNH